MSDCDSVGVARGIRIERAQAARPFDGFDRRLGLVAQRVDVPSGRPGVSRVRVEREGAVESRHRQRRLAGEEKQRPGGLPNRFGVIPIGFERLSGQAAGLDDVVGSQRSPPLQPLQGATPADHGCSRRVERIDRQRLPGKDNRLGNALIGIAVGLRQCAR